MLGAVPLILAAEAYEDGGAAAPGGAERAHGHDEASADEKSGRLRRGALTLLGDVLAAIGFAFVLIGAIAISGRDVDWRRGILWGLGGFAAFHAAPSLGLPPELPGMHLADLGPRQGWWLATAACTAVGLALVFLVRPLAARAGGALLIVAPHLVGAPAEEMSSGAVPAELASEFAVVSLMTAALFWVVLGALGGYLYRRLGRA